MRRKQLLLLAVAVVALAGCNMLNTYVTSQAGQSQGGQQPGTTLVPAGSVTAVAVSKFGEDCDGSASPTDNPTTVRVGCTARLTCTPKCGARDCTPTEHGSQPDFFGVISGGQYVQVAGEDNLFNLNARGLGPGQVSFGCTVKGMASAQRVLEVVN